MGKETVAGLDLIADPLEEAEISSLMGPECVIDSSSGSCSDCCGVVWNTTAAPL